MEIRVNLKVPVSHLSVQLEIFKEEDRPDVIPLINAISEAEERNIDPTSYLKQYHFPKLPITFVANLLEELRLMGLVQDGVLTSR